MLAVDARRQHARTYKKNGPQKQNLGKKALLKWNEGAKKTRRQVIEEGAVQWEPGEAGEVPTAPAEQQKQQTRKSMWGTTVQFVGIFQRSHILLYVAPGTVHCYHINSGGGLWP